MRPFLTTTLTLTLTLASLPALANQANDVLQSLSDAKRNELLTRFMAGSGESCKVTENFFQGLDKRRSAFWSVRCSSKQAFSIMIKDDSTGSTKILSCKALKAIAGVDCFKKF